MGRSTFRTMDRLLAAVDRLLARLTRREAIALACAAVVSVGLLDYATGPNLSMALFYLAPVAAAAWYAGRRAGVTVASLAALEWLAADLLSRSSPHASWVSLWNAAARLGMFVVTAELMWTVRAALDRERRLSRTDSLTGLLLRRSFHERLAHDVELARRWRGVLTIAYVDVDDFKTINDAHGHSAGDRALCKIAAVLADATRRADSVARLGGDEFALVLPDTDTGGAARLMERLRADLARAFAEDRFEVTCSIGVVTFLEPPASAEAAVAEADALMYRVKTAGKGAVAYGVSGEGPCAPRGDGASGREGVGGQEPSGARLS